MRRGLFYDHGHQKLYYGQKVNGTVYWFGVDSFENLYETLACRSDIPLETYSVKSEFEISDIFSVSGEKLKESKADCRKV